MFFGRHKLAPVVSPKKTVEGAVGGVIGGAVLVLIAALIMNSTLKLGLPLWAAVVLGAVGAVLGEIGDLSFSIIKRQTGIKDYGHIFPGSRRRARPLRQRDLCRAVRGISVPHRILTEQSTIAAFRSFRSIDYEKK